MTSPATAARSSSARASPANRSSRCRMTSRTPCGTSPATIAAEPCSSRRFIISLRKSGLPCALSRICASTSASTSPARPRTNRAAAPRSSRAIGSVDPSRQMRDRSSLASASIRASTSR